MDIDRMRGYAASERHDEALEDLVSACVNLVTAWQSLSEGALHCGQTEAQRMTARAELAKVSNALAPVRQLLEELAEEEE